MSTANSMPFVERLWPAAGIADRTLRAAALIAIGSLLLVASAKTQVPFWPVPMTLQTLAVVLIGATYGSRLGFATLLAYLLEGAAGLPVFAGTPERGIGLAYMMGPTGGYLVGFLVAATVIGWLVERGFARTLLTTALSVFAVHAIVHAFGLGWLAGFAGAGKAFAAGFVPFLPADIVKALLATAIVFGVGQNGTR